MASLCGLGFLTTQWPHGGQSSYTETGALRESQGHLKTHEVTFAIHTLSKSSHKGLLDSKCEDTGPTSQ